MVVKSQLKLIKSLQQKKYRNQQGLFVAEGIKVVGELLQSSFVPHQIYAMDVSDLQGVTNHFIKVSEKELKQMSGLKAPNKVLGVFQMAQPKAVDFSDWILVVDTVQDPGNLGTIIRLCDWFKIAHLVCSQGTVDIYNPKVLQATMGSLARVNVVYADVIPFLEEAPLPIYGAFADGNSMYTMELPKSGILVLGNEGKGISPEVETWVTKRISIPQVGPKTAESLNVATAGAILLSRIRMEP